MSHLAFKIRWDEPGFRKTSGTRESMPVWM